MFKTKKELLEYLWKKGNDNKLVDRLMVKGIVEKVDGWYILHDPQQEEIDRLKGRIGELEKKLEKGLANQTTASSSELEEYKANCEYWHNQFRKMKRGYELVIEMTYKEIIKHTKIEKSEYIEQLWDAVREIIDNEFWHED